MSEEMFEACSLLECAASGMIIGIVRKNNPNRLLTMVMGFLAGFTISTINQLVIKPKIVK